MFGTHDIENLLSITLYQHLICFMPLLELAQFPLFTVSKLLNPPGQGELENSLKQYHSSITHNLFGVFMYGEPSNTIHTIMHKM